MLANGEDLTHFGTRTLKAALAERSHNSEDMLDPVEAFDREIERVMREPRAAFQLLRMRSNHSEMIRSAACGRLLGWIPNALVGASC